METVWRVLKCQSDDDYDVDDDNNTIRVTVNVWRDTEHKCVVPFFSWKIIRIGN